jgi:hypothetical protein
VADETTRLFDKQCPVPTGNTLLDACLLERIVVGRSTTKDSEQKILWDHSRFGNEKSGLAALHCSQLIAQSDLCLLDQCPVGRFFIRRDDYRRRDPVARFEVQQADALR